jgi:hypothetical protein
MIELTKEEAEFLLRLLTKPVPLIFRVTEGIREKIESIKTKLEARLNES